MIEKLLENWLDSASERSYQTCFVQMLAAQGYNVLHSTRHCALEYGKDVLAIAPDGVPCAFQLKGNPGGRLTLREFRSDVQPQLVQLMAQPIVFPGVDTARSHRSFLVTNGYFDEEVQRAVDDLNRGPYPSKLELISRGQLLGWATELGVGLWPSEIGDFRELLEIFLHDGRDILPLSQLARMLEGIFGLAPETSPLSRADLLRAAPSGALFTGIATSRFTEAENHYAVVSAWCALVASLIGSAERSSLELRGSARECLTVAEKAIKDALVALWNEAMARGHLVEGNPIADSEIFRWRYTLLCGLFATLFFFPVEDEEDLNRRTAISEWINGQHSHLQLWGEGAIPAILAHLLALRRTNATIRPDLEIANLLSQVVQANQSGSANALPDPYYAFEDVARARLGLDASDSSTGVQEETFAGSSYSAELLLHLVVRARLKTPCRVIWPNFNRLGHRRFVPSAAWEFCLVRASEGDDQTRQYPPEYRWGSLCSDASVDTCLYVPKEFVAKPHLLLLWTILVPQRLTSDVGRLLAARLPW